MRSKNRIDNAVILAGGYGSRMLPFTEHLPKALTLFNGIPILYHQINQLQRLKVSSVFILTGYLHDQISKYLSEVDFNISISIIKSPDELSPAQRILVSQKTLPKNFLLLYCDNYIPDDEFVRHILDDKYSYTFSLQKRDTGNIKILSENRLDFRNYRYQGNDLFVELGYIGIKDPNFFQILSLNRDLSAALQHIGRNLDISYKILHSTYFSASNIKLYVEQNIKNKIIFLDRDGIINHRPKAGAYVECEDNFYIVSDNWEYLKHLSSNGFYFIIITNQAGIALEKIPKNSLKVIHNLLALKMISSNINFLGIYFCPHHWNDNCNCRKPRAGLIARAMRELGLTGSNYLMIGDSQSDVDAGLAAGIQGFLTNDGTFGYLERARPMIEEVYKVKLN